MKVVFIISKSYLCAKIYRMSIFETIQKRRAVFAAAYNGTPISKDKIEQILATANWAPTHKRTEPWRFHVFLGESLQKLSDYLSDYYVANTPETEYSEVKHKKAGENPLKAGAVIAIVMKKHEGIPEWEEIAAVAMAVQNMWLACTALGIGAYWATPKAALESHLFLELAEEERCLGFFYMGNSDMPLVEGTRKTGIAEKTVWK